MCHTCDEITRSLAGLKLLAGGWADPLTTRPMSLLIAEMEDRLSEMHAAAGAPRRREPDSLNKRSEWRVGQRVSRKTSTELGRVIEVNGKVKVKWDGGRTSVFAHGDMANVELSGRA